MLKSFKILRSYYKLSSLKWGFILFEFIILLIPSLLSILTPILSANLISSLTVYDFKRAKLMLSLDFVIIIVTAILYFIYHFLSTKAAKIILFNTSDYVYENIKNNKKINKVNSSTMADIWTFSNFNNSFLYKVCFLIKSIVILIIIFSHNFLISLSLVGISIASALLLSLTNKQIQKNTLSLNESKTKSLELFNSIQKGISLDNNSFMENTMKYKYFDVVDSSVKTNNKISLFYSLNNNFITLILKSAVFLFTFYLISQVKSTYLSLSSFLILTPYLTSSAQNLIAFFDIFPEIAIIDNIIFEFKSFDKKNQEKDAKSELNLPNNYNIQFFHTNLSGENYSISDFSLNIEYKSIIQFIGDSGCGKRAIFDMINKKQEVSSGSVFIGDININAIADNDFSKIVSSSYKQPYFYNISILENLLIACQNKAKITKAIKELSLENIINSLPNKVDTIINEDISQKYIFFLGILRTYLISPKIICIYEFPENFEKTDYELFYHCIKVLNNSSTVILFLHKPLTLTIDSSIYYIENSRLKPSN